jgi:hypothetical protein
MYITCFPLPVLSQILDQWVRFFPLQNCLSILEVGHCSKPCTQALKPVSVVCDPTALCASVMPYRNNNNSYPWLESEKIIYHVFWVLSKNSWPMTLPPAESPLRLRGRDIARNYVPRLGNQSLQSVTQQHSQLSGSPRSSESWHVIRIPVN